MLSYKAYPWTGKELNKLTGEDKFNCSIRKGLIHWTGKTEYSSEQEICDKGEELLPLFWEDIKNLLLAFRLFPTIFFF